ncbi:MAG: dihydroxyacetone kinase subunit DhaL [Rhodospirillales bacterium]
MGITVEELRQAAHALARTAEAAADELNAQDGKLGDGDLGVTLRKGWQAVAESAAEFPDDMGMAFLSCSKAFQKVSSSSFGTLVATGFMSAAKAAKGRRELEWSEVAGLLVGARDAMMARGKGALGDKTVLDSLDAAAKATAGLSDPAEILAAVDAAADDALAAFRQKPNRLGRARVYAERSIGLDDPGMLAFRRLLDGLKG